MFFRDLHGRQSRITAEVRLQRAIVNSWKRTAGRNSIPALRAQDQLADALTPSSEALALRRDTWSAAERSHHSLRSGVQ